MNIIWGFNKLKEAAQALLSLHLSKYHNVGNHMSRLKLQCTCHMELAEAVPIDLWSWHFLVTAWGTYMKHMWTDTNGRRVLVSVTHRSALSYEEWHPLYTYCFCDKENPPKNSKWVWSGNTTITNCRQPRGIARKSRSTITRHQEDKLSKNQNNSSETGLSVEFLTIRGWNFLAPQQYIMVDTFSRILYVF